MESDGPLPAFLKRTDDASKLPEGECGLVSIPVEVRGRRFKEQDLSFQTDTDHIKIPLLDHAGPEASVWASSQSVSACERTSFLTGRQPHVFTDDEWVQLFDNYETTAQTLKTAGVCTAVLALDDDGLLASALAKNASKQAYNNVGLLVQRLNPYFEALGVALCVEDLSPGGSDAIKGVRVAQDMVSQGAGFVIASSGSWAFPPLKHRARTKARGQTEVAQNEAWMASPAWLLGRTEVPIYACGPVQSMENAMEKAKHLGFAGVVHWTPQIPGTFK
jgi:hypothetical protein